MKTLFSRGHILQFSKTVFKFGFSRSPLQSQLRGLRPAGLTAAASAPALGCVHSTSICTTIKRMEIPHICYHKEDSVVPVVMEKVFMDDLLIRRVFK